MNFSGLLVGLATFLIIGLFHPIVIKSEYHFGVRCWWVFLLVGIAFAIASCMVQDIVISTILGVTAFLTEVRLQVPDIAQQVPDAIFLCSPL